MALCIGTFIFLYISLENLNKDLEVSNLKTQSMIKINKLTKQLYLNQMSSLFQMDNRSVENHEVIIDKITEYLNTIKANSHARNENDLLDMVDIYLVKYDVFFEDKITPYFNKQYALARNAMSYSLAEADEIEETGISTAGRINNTTINKDNYDKFIKELEAKLEISRNQIDLAKKNQLNYDGSLIIEKLQKNIDQLEQTFIHDSKNLLDRVNKSTNYVSLGSIFIVAFLGMYLSVALGNSITKPIRSLIDKMNLVEDGNLETEVYINSSDEFGQLGKSFNNMVISLKDANSKLNARQQELSYLNEILMTSNEEIERAYQELKQTQIQLVQHEKMASLGMLVAGIAHEINTPLGAINCNVDLYKVLIGKLKERPNITEDRMSNDIVMKLDKANQTNVLACERIMNIVKGLKNFARLDEAEYQLANIHEGIDNTLILLNNKLKNRVSIIKEYGEKSEILCYPNQLNQVFMNLLVNASDAIKEKGTIWIKTYVEGSEMCIKIKDNGIGIKQEHIGKIFDPGFTTKGVGVGTGLGLSIVYRIIEKHKGKIYVQSVYEKGTEFTIQLPVNLQEKNVEK